MRHLPLLLIITLCLAVMTGCRHEYDARLIHAEEMMIDHPDSALAILEDLDSASLRGGDLALYALLKTEAQDKLFMDPTNDSLIKVAVNYFSNSNERERSAKAFYYQGRVRYFSDSLPEAMVSYFQAKDIAEHNGLPFWSAQSCRRISDIAMALNNAPEALNYAKKELENFRRSGRQPFINNAIYDAALCHYNAGDHDEAERCALEALDSAKVSNNDELLYSALQILGFIDYAKGNYERASGTFRDICQSGYSTPDDSVYWGISLYMHGKRAESIKFLKTVSSEGTLLKNVFISHYYAENGEFATAYKERLYIDSINGRDAKMSLNNTVTSNLDTYFQMNQRIHRMKVENMRIKIIIGIIILSILLVMGIIGFWYRHRRQQQEISNNLRIAQELQEAFERTQAEYSRVCGELDYVKSSHSYGLSRTGKSSVLIRTLLRGRFEMLDMLTEVVSQSKNVKAGRQKVSDYVTGMVDSFIHDGEKVNALKRQVDELFDNLITDLTASLPRLKEADVRLFLFSVMGLSNSTIAVFLEEDEVEAVYTRRRRLKDKIKKLPSAVAERFLGFL